MLMTEKVYREAVFNLLIAVHDPDEWPHPTTMTVRSTRQEASVALRGWGPQMADIVGLFPEELTKYGVFDMADNPPPSYASGRVCVAGDAAHASSPFHGAGVCMGVEDALVLAELLADVQRLPVDARPASLTAALQAYSAVRMPRTRWCMQSSRDMGDIWEWRYSATGQDGVKIKAEFEARARKIWDFDVDAMVSEARLEYERRVRT
jgi:salicylate hydroxylase